MCKAKGLEIFKISNFKIFVTKLCYKIEATALAAKFCPEIFKILENVEYLKVSKFSKFWNFQKF